MVLELLFALLLVALLVAVGGILATVAGVARRAEAQATQLTELRAQLEAGDATQRSAAGELRLHMGRTQELMEGMRQAVAARERLEDEARLSLRRLEAVISGSSTRGVAGENILEEAFRHLPPEMLQRNVWVRGKVVEFGLRLPGGKVLPIDSKWTAVAALDEISGDVSPERRQQLAAGIEKEVEKRVREVSQYIDPATTTPFALAAIPDGAFAVCRGAFAEAHRRHVIIVGFSMAMPYLLSLYQLHLQFARTVDMDNLQAYLMDIDRQLETLDASLENKLRRAMTMLENSFSDGKQVVASVRASVHGIQASERVGDVPPRRLSALDPIPELALVEPDR